MREAGAEWLAQGRASPGGPVLRDGSRVAVVGGGPAGSFFSYFLLDLAARAGLRLQLDLFETRDFSRPAPCGCNMCGGIISESLVQMLAADGINLPPTIVQRGIEAYVLHTDVGSVRIETPLHEKRIGAVYRGAGPRDIKEMKWGSFDGHLQGLAKGKGARVVAQRVDAVRRVDGRPEVRVRGGEFETYDLLAAAVGVNSGALGLFRDLGIGFEPPRATKTFIREYYLGEDRIVEVLGDAMHVFLLDIPRLEFAAIIPKGDYMSVCLLGEEIDAELVRSFLESPEVKRVVPPGWKPEARSCQCAPRINVGAAAQPFADRVVFIGDCAVTRLYKDGIGAAYRTAKAAAQVAAYEGISAETFRRHYSPVCRSIERDNAIGRVTFGFSRLIQKLRIARRGVLRMTAAEQRRASGASRMSGVLWDLFTGSSSYRDVFVRTLHPAFLARFLWSVGASALPTGRRTG